MSGQTKTGYSCANAIRMLTQVATDTMLTQFGFAWIGFCFQESRCGQRGALRFLALRAPYSSRDLWPGPSVRLGSDSREAQKPLNFQTCRRDALPLIIPLLLPLFL